MTFSNIIEDFICYCLGVYFYDHMGLHMRHHYMQFIVPHFYISSLKGPLGASSNWIVCQSVCLFFFVILYRLNKKCNI